jgi:hypothetical protein
MCAAMLLSACGTTVSTPSPLPSIAPSTMPTAVPDTFDIPSAGPATASPEPSDTETGNAGTPACPVDELKASRGITEVDGDDRTTEVVLVAADTCSIDAYPTLLLEDADSNIIVAVNAAGTGGIDLVGGVAYSSEVRLGNWCLDEPSYPVSIGILQGIQTLLVTGDSFPDEDDLPACLHDDADPVLSGTAWSPKP